MSRSAAHGYFCWHELMSKDPAGSEAFYTGVVGWTAAKMPTPGHDYTILSWSGQQMAGLMQLPDEAAAMGAPSQWVGYMTVTDIQETVAAVGAAGGQVFMPATAVPGVGTIAMFADPWGATFAVMQPESGNMAVPPKSTPGGFAWNELYTSNAAAALSFYQGLFGWELLSTMDMGPMGSYHILGRGDRQFVGLMQRPEQVAHDCWLSYIEVTDIAGGVARAQAAGGQLLTGPHQVPGGDFVAQVCDPQGVLVGLHARR